MLLLAWLLAPAFAHPLKFSTWNLDWLTLRPAGDPTLPSGVSPKDPEALARLRAYALHLDADVIAFQEADGPGMAARIFPPDRYQIVMADGLEVQRTGFAIRNGIAFSRNPDLLALKLDKQGLRAGTDITVTEDGHNLRLLAVHLKSGCSSQALAADEPACAELAKQLPVLQAWITARGGEAFAIMGDFNRRLGAGEKFWAGLETAAPLALPDEGRDSPCWGGGGFIDHIVLGGEARQWLMPQSLRVMLYHESAEWKPRLSDHCPVSVRLDIP
jgi:endonuclease/exonuclease/phosphatase family metal-dependent hydrolase